MMALWVALLLLATPCDAQRDQGAPTWTPPEQSAAERAAFGKAQREAACALARLPTPAEPDPKGRERLLAILARPELARAQEADHDYAARFVDLVALWLGRLLQTRGAQSYANATRFLMLGAAALVALFGLFRVLARRRAGRTGHPQSTGGSPGSRKGLRLAPAADHLARARALLAGRPREALREALLALLSALERRRFARPDRVTTNRELALELPRRGAPAELEAQVAPLLREYDARFYSLEPLVPAVAEAFLERVARLAAQLAEGA